METSLLILHSSQDQSIASSLQEFISSVFGETFSTYLYTSVIPILGTRVPDAILQRVNNFTNVAVLLTPNSLNDAWFHTIVGYALSLNKIIFPCLLEVEYNDIPSPLDNFQAVVLDKYNDLEKLVEAIGEEIIILDIFFQRIIMEYERYFSNEREKLSRERVLNINFASNMALGVPLTDVQFISDVFVIMPFAEEFLSIYSDEIKPPIEELGLSVKRGDDFWSRSLIMREVWSAIYNCSLVIAECTGRNANVFYELGIAHTLDKPVVMLTQDENDIPFDIRHLRHIKYEPTGSGLNILKEQLKSAVRQQLNLPT